LCEIFDVKKFVPFQNGHWNGLVSELVNKKFDMVLTSLKVNAEREAAVDFTAPFLESGTTILVFFIRQHKK
jgi:ABC-type amino acid transport substrate-binding protein